MSRGNRADVFRLRLIGRGEEIRLKAKLVLNGITFKLYELIVTAPEHRVDTGRLRMAWAVAVEEPGDFVPRPVSKEVLAERRRTGDRSPIFDVPQAEQYIATIINAPLEAKRIIYNNVEYAVWVELGTEQSEGQHVAKLAVARLISGPPSVAEMVA